MRSKLIFFLFFILIIVYLICSRSYISSYFIHKNSGKPPEKESTFFRKTSHTFISLRFEDIGFKAVSGIASVTPEKFEKCVSYLKNNGYYFLSAKEVYDFIVNGLPVPENSVWLTFDAGMESQYIYVTPLFKKYGARATTFISVSWIRKDYRLNNHQLLSMSKSGLWDIQSQGYMGNLLFPINKDGMQGNFYLNRLWQIDRPETISEYRDRIKKDLTDASKYIKTNFNSECFLFSYSLQEPLKELENKADILRLLISCFDELKILGIGSKDYTNMLAGRTTNKHFLPRYTVSNSTDIETVIYIARLSAKNIP